jgi:hypothetical protein
MGCPECREEKSKYDESCENCLIGQSKFVTLYKLNNDDLVTRKQLEGLNVTNKSEFVPHALSNELHGNDRELVYGSNNSGNDFGGDAK